MDEMQKKFNAGPYTIEKLPITVMGMKQRNFRISNCPAQPKIAKSLKLTGTVVHLIFYTCGEAALLIDLKSV
jgi:hypothetical protein